MKQVDEILERYPDDKEVLYIKGSANALGHNLDYPGSADRAMETFEKLLSIDPNNRRATYAYGVFLSQTTLQSKAIPYLTKAIQLGEERAHYTLGITYLGMGATQDAIPEFEAYLKVYPEDVKIQKLLTDLKSGEREDFM
ncbi:MAG: tetratricopeptide repeat protein [Nitrosomonadales bacterium]